VTKRYSDFAEMHEQLVALFPSATIPKVPGKKLINNLDKNFIEKRRGKLCNFLQSLSQQPALASSSVFLAFIEDTNEMNTDDWQELFDGLVPMPHDAQRDHCARGRAERLALSDGQRHCHGRAR
jgi:hypothetical protein